jgi:hypothetical protein
LLDASSYEVAIVVKSTAGEAAGIVKLPANVEHCEPVAAIGPSTFRGESRQLLRRFERN